MDNLEYKILHTGHPAFPRLVVGLSRSNLYNSMSDIVAELQRDMYRGMVIFDQLSTHGNSKTRFVKAFFDGSSFSSISSVDRAEVPVSLEVAAFEYLGGLKSS